MLKGYLKAGNRVKLVNNCWHCKERRKKELEVINKENPENKEILKARIAAMLRKKNTTPDSDM